MTGDRFKVRTLAAEWGTQIGVDPMTLARALFEAALAGEFENLEPANRLTIFDEKRLIHSPVVAQKVLDRELYIILAVRTGSGWIHRDAVIAFATADGRNYTLPNAVSHPGQLVGLASYNEVAKLIAARPSITKEAARLLVKEAVGTGYGKVIFEQAWSARPAKTSGGRPRKNPS